MLFNKSLYPVRSIICKGIQDSLGFLISRHGFPILVGLDSLSLELGFLIPVVSGIPDSKAQDSDSTSKKFPA